MKNVTMGGYIILLHLTLAAAFYDPGLVNRIKANLGYMPEELSPFYYTNIALQQRIANNLSPDAIVFIGDSHVQGLAVSSVHKHSENFGIGNDTTYGVIQRLPKYQKLDEVKTVVLSIGFNDLRYRDNSDIVKNIVYILNHFSKDTKIVLNAISPVGAAKHALYNERILYLNAQYKLLSQSYQNVTYVNAFESHINIKGFLPQKYLLSDHIHLSEEGYKIWINVLSALLGAMEGS